MKRAFALQSELDLVFAHHTRTQPTISQTVKRLEKELGQKLFDRSPARYRRFYRGTMRPLHL